MLHRGDRRTLTTKQVHETEAESVTFVVCQAIGDRNRPADYIHLWHGDADLVAVQQPSAVIPGGIAS